MFHHAKNSQLTRSLRMSQLRVCDVMTRDPVTLRADDDLGHANKIMERHAIRHLPVVNSAKRLQGILTHRDILRFTVSETAQIGTTNRRLLRFEVPVCEAMSLSLSTVSPDSLLSYAASILWETKIGCVPAVDSDNRLLGILTESDFVALFAQGFSN